MMNNNYHNNLKNEIIKVICRSPANLASMLTGGKYKIPKHIAYLDKLLLAASFRKHKRLIISLPPRHGKSELISKYFPFWYLGNFPKHRIILTSYEATFAAGWGRQVRDLIQQYGNTYFNISIADGASAVQNFALNSGGMMYSVGAGGAITGKGAELLIIDDPVKNDAEANSPTIRDNIWEWFLSTAFTRIEPNGIIIIVMTRWNEDDLVGRLLENFADEWLYVKLPALAETGDPLGREEGEALWQERFSLDSLHRIKRQIGSYWFSSLYQQSPAPVDGAVFHRQYFKYFVRNNNYYYLDGKPEPIAIENCMIYATADLAISTSDKSDYTAIVIFANSPNSDILILEVIRERIDASKHLELIKNIRERFNTRLIGIESVQYQAALIRQSVAIGLPVMPLRADKDKYSRALPMAAAMEAGRVYFAKDAHWLDNFEKEILSFPNGKHDDQTDAFAYISSISCSGNKVMPAIGKKLKLSRFTNS